MAVRLFCFFLAAERKFAILAGCSAKTKLDLPRVPREVTPVEIPLAAERHVCRSTSHESPKQGEGDEEEPEQLQVSPL